MQEASPGAPFDLSSDEFRRWATHAIEFAARWLERETQDPVLEHISGRQLSDALDSAPPLHGAEFETVFEEFENVIARHSRANGHPRYFAYVSASADPAGMIADFLAASLNQNVTAWRSSPGAAAVEQLVLRWMDELTGFGGGNGILTGGGSAANFNALAMAVARAERIGVPRTKMVAYISADTHFSLAKAARILGLPATQVRALSVDTQRRLSVEALRSAVAHDIEHQLYPLFVCASAGTANCGAIDPISAIAEIASRHSIWLHVDGAYGAPAAMTDSHHWLRAEFAQADSLSIDPHKWLFAPLDAGCLLFRDAALARETFSETAAYTAVTQTDPVEAHAFFDYGMELSRRFRALKLWFAIKLHGTAAFSKAIENNIMLRQHTDECIAADERLEALASGLSISCFRVVRAGMNQKELNALNQRILEALLQSGRFLLSPTELDGNFALRVCIVNFRTQREDIDALLDAVTTTANQLSAR